MGVLFEISIVCHVLCSWFWRVGWGFSLFWGLFWLVRRVFSGFWGFLCFSFVLLLLVGVGGGLRGVPGLGVGAPGCLASFLLGGGSGVRLRAPECLASSLLGGAGSGARVARFPWWGSGCARFLLLLVVVGVFGCCFFRPVLSVFFWFLVLVFVVLPGVGGLWGVSGWVRGCFFSGFCCTGPGLFPVSFVGAGLGLGWVLFGEFDPGSGRTLAACLTHASRTGPPSFLGVG